MALHQDLKDCMNRTVVLDTLEHVLFLGTLTEVTENGFWLSDADVHDCREGHAGKEVYIAEACRDGISVNRSRVFVLRASVCSLSRLDAIGAADELPAGLELQGAPVTTPHGPADLAPVLPSADPSSAPER